MFSKGRIRLVDELGTEACFVIAGNAGRLARTWGGGKRVMSCPTDKPAFDRRVTHLEGAHHVGTRHAAIKRVKHAFSEIERVWFHWCVLYHKLIFSAHYYIPASGSFGASGCLCEARYVAPSGTTVAPNKALELTAFAW